VSASEQSPEKWLIGQIRAGNSKLFHQLIEPYERPLFALAYAVLKNAADAEEAVQEALMKVYQNLDQLQGAERFRSWLLRIALNEARMKRRRERRYLFEPLEDSAPNDAEYALRQFADWRELPSDFAEMAELRSAVRQAIENLPDKYREVYILSDNQHLSMEEIADVLGISIPAVKSRLHRARLRIQVQLAPRFRWRWKDRIQLLKGMNPWSR
jgi:RNA polymerase sigma-70 factor (ECF subfamily)